jgi:hypothetical protein
VLSGGPVWDDGERSLGAGGVPEHRPHHPTLEQAAGARGPGGQRQRHGDAGRVTGHAAFPAPHPHPTLAESGVASQLGQAVVHEGGGWAQAVRGGGTNAGLRVAQQRALSAGGGNGGSRATRRCGCWWGNPIRPSPAQRWACGWGVCCGGGGREVWGGWGGVVVGQMAGAGA